MARKRRLHKRYGKKYKRNPEGSSQRKNPPLLTDLAEFIGPGFAGFAATRLLTRIAATQLAKKKPSWGKHAGAITSILSFCAAYWGANRIKMFAKYHTPIVVGSAIAALQSLIQLYVPKLGWMIADASPQIADEQNLQLTGGQAARQLPTDSSLEYLDEDAEDYAYNDSFDAGRFTPNAAPTYPAQAKPTEEDILEDLGLHEDAGDLNLGSLGAS